MFAETATILAHQQKELLEDMREKLSWQGQANFYQIKRFFRAVQEKETSFKKTRTLDDWLSLCPQASEINPHIVVESILKPERPIASEDIPTWMRRFPRTTAWDLRIQHPVVLRRYPNHGGNMAQVGPLASN